MISIKSIMEDCCARGLVELASIPRNSSTYTVPANETYGLDQDYVFYNIPLQFQSFDMAKKYQPNPTRAKSGNIGGNQAENVSTYLPTELGGDPALNRNGEVMGTTTFYWKLFSNPQKISSIINKIGNKIDNQDYHPIMNLLDDIRFFTGQYNQISLEDFWTMNPGLRNTRLPVLLNLIKSLSPNWRGETPGDRSRLSTYSAEFRPDEPATDDMFYTKFGLSGTPPVNLNQRGIYLWVFNGTQVKYVGIAGKNNNLSGRFNKYTQVQMDACGTLGPNCRINNAILQAQMQLRPGKNPNDYIKWFVLPLGNEITNPQLEALEEKFIKYFGTRADMEDPIINPQNYSTPEAWEKIKQRGSIYSTTPNRQTKQGVRGKLNRK